MQGPVHWRAREQEDAAALADKPLQRRDRAVGLPQQSARETHLRRSRSPDGPLPPFLDHRLQSWLTLLFDPRGGRTNPSRLRGYGLVNPVSARDATSMWTATWV